MHSFPKICLLITHYNRSKSLEHLLESFRLLECCFGNIVVSDDGSNVKHLKYVKKLQGLYSFELITSPTNKGLGNNINKGQDIITTPYTLYIQEDFEPKAIFPGKLKRALRFMEVDNELDYIRFYAYHSYPYLKPFKDGFSEMYIKPFGFNYTKIYYYSDHPHLRRTCFFDKFGRYAEGLKGDRTEYKMCVSFIQKKGKGLFYDDYQGLLKQKNSFDEPSTMIRKSWRQNNSFFTKIIRDVYRQFKYNYDLLMLPPHNNS